MQDKQIYSNFASVYDRLMIDIPYEAWVEYLEKLLNHFDIRNPKILDLGCGTGNISIPLASLGYDVTALDVSPEMLALAEQKAREKELNIQFICQDMRDISMINKFDVVISMVDSFNYLTEEEDLEKTLAGVKQILKPGGWLIFDLNSAYKIREVFGDNTYSLIEDDVCYIWENQYAPDKRVCAMEVTFFVREEKDTYKRFTEIHQERAFEIEEIEKKLAEQEFQLQKVFNELGFDNPNSKEERVFLIAKKF